MAVEIREEQLELPTYVWGAPDPNPPFQRSGTWTIYPYPLLDDIGEQARSVAYRALVVENEYLRVVVLPELGGRIFSAQDKASGEELFYRNNVVKPGLIALRGVWISGGVEWNFPRGHTVTTLSPVDARMMEEDDGSAVIWVGDVERVYRMGWAVGIRLRPGAAFLETEIRLTNHTDLPHPYYFWANAAVSARDDMRLVYPGTRAFTWRDANVQWPVHQGRDLSRHTAFPGANDVFLLDSLEDFFGVYYEERDFGLVHYADVHECVGKKLFTWGTAHHGKVWSAALSDGDGPYCEVQSGRFLHQGMWRIMQPHWNESWREWWYPVKGTGGFTRANTEAAVRVASSNGSVECAAAVTRPQPGATVQVLLDGRSLRQERVDLAPDRPLRMEMPLERAEGGEVTMVLLDRAGRELIRYTEGQRPRTAVVRDEPHRPEGEQRTAGELLRRALRAEERADPEGAADLYREALENDPACLEAVIALGRIAIERGGQDAVPMLERAATHVPQSLEAAYYLGVALARAGRDTEADRELRRAARGPGLAHAAWVEVGLIRMRHGSFEGAAEAFRMSLRYQPEEPKARAMLGAALRRCGRPVEAVEALEAGEPSCAVDRAVLAEHHFCAEALGHPRIAARRLRQLGDVMPKESDPWLEVAVVYGAAGLLEEGRNLLEWAVKRVPGAKRCPLIHYLLSHWLNLMGEPERAEEVRRRAGTLSAHLVFPHHWELESALRDALMREPEDSLAHYLLGTLLYSQGRREEGIAEWEAARAGMDGFSVLHRNLGRGYWRVQGDLDAAEREYRRGFEANPADVRLLLEFNDVMRERGLAAQERLAVLDAAAPSAQRRGTVAAQQILCCIELERWDRAVELLRTHTFHRWEMEFRMRGIYLEVFLERGIARFDRGDLQGAREDFESALEYPMNVRIGRPPKPADARAHWCAGVACEALGDLDAAVQHWKAAAEESYHHPGKELAIYHALSLKKVGRDEEADALLAEALELAQQCAEMAPDEPQAQFALGLTLKAVGRNEEAAHPLRRANELAPKLRRAERLLERDVIL